MIVQYYCTRNGTLTKRGECEEQFIKGIPDADEVLHIGFPPDDLPRFQVEKDWRQKRKEAYPAVENQLDLLWHAMDQGAMPKVEPFYSVIAAVKLAHPKPSN